MKQDLFLTRVAATIRRHDLMPDRARVLVAVSGGADSTALLLALAAWAPRHRATLVAAHLHHGLRGKEADRDAAHVRALCRALRIPLVTGRADVSRLARASGVSIEMAARRARRGFLARAARARKCSCIAVGHTADDQAETVLMRVVQGTGPRGMGGMSYRSLRDGLPLIRPLLDVTHGEAADYCRARQVAWREDASNRDASMLRNRLRHELLPQLERRFNPAVRQSLIRLSDVMREEESWLDGLTAAHLDACRSAGSAALDVRRLRVLPMALRRRILMRWLMDGGIAAEALDYGLLERIVKLAAQSSGSQSVPAGGAWHVAREYEKLRLVKKAGAPRRAKPLVLREGSNEYAVLGLRVALKKALGFKRIRNTHVGKWPAECWVDAGRVGRSRLTLRPWRAGDRLKPFGLTGSVKVQDVFVNAKVPRGERAGIPVLTCRGEVIWVPGYRVARDWAVSGPKARSWHVRLTAAG
jgi:tRNA(Ile)-lysidine synthase